MPPTRTLVTELATGLGTLGIEEARAATRSRPVQFIGVADADWTTLTTASESRDYQNDFESGLANGIAFFRSLEGLAERVPRSIEWTGGRRSLGDETVPADLRIDRVYLLSCKYLSRVLHNRSPAQLVVGLLGTGSRPDESDWFSQIAPENYQALYEAAESSQPSLDLPREASQLSGSQRRSLATSLTSGWEEDAAEQYRDLCEVVGERTAERWRSNIAAIGSERMFWRLLRIGPAPYFVLGSDSHGSMRLRIDTPWDWRQRYRFLDMEVAAQTGGQPRVGWTAQVRELESGSAIEVRGHVEVRWSHGRFGQPPEAKVYLDTPHSAVPGYHPL